MNKKQTLDDYEVRISRIIDYIYDNLDQDLTTTRLSEVACFSAYHWHRIYRSMTGETADDAIRRLRLHRAAGDLAKSDLPIARVARRANYGSVAAFSRAFRSSFGVPPATYRSTGCVPQAPYPTRSIGANHMFDVEIEMTPTLRLATIEHIGSYMDIGKAFEKLMVHAGSKGWITGPPRMIGIYHDDPSEVAQKDLRSQAGLVISPHMTAPDGKVATEFTMPEGRSAAMVFKGPYAEMEGAYKWLFGTWLPKSGEEAADSPCFEEYLNNPREVAPSDLLTKIFLPLQ